MNKSVELYSLSTCSHCKSVKNLFQKENIDYNYTDIDLLEGDERSDAIKTVKKLNYKCSFPTICIGDKIIVGFKENEIKEALGL